MANAPGSSTGKRIGISLAGVSALLLAAAPRAEEHHVPMGLTRNEATPAALNTSVAPPQGSAPPPVFGLPFSADDPLDVSRNEPPRGWSLVSLPRKGAGGAIVAGAPRHWQRNTDGPTETPEETDAREGNRGSCPAGMVEVEGRMKQSSMLDALQLQACTRWIDRKFPERCGEYDREAWLALSAKLPTKPMHYCIDRFEYPNVRGQNPIVMVTWYEAQNACRAQGKRLCSEDEWTFACEGEEAQPYPNGYSRDAGACVIDEPWEDPAEGTLLPRQSPRAGHEVARLWHAEASGGERSCKSPFGVYDLTGNVDEWTRSSIGGRQSILKGGYFGPVRTRCRPATRAHGEGHVYYQQGFRCCASANDS